MDKYVARYFKDDEFVAEREFYAEDFDSADHKATELVDVWTWNYMTLCKIMQENEYEKLENGNVSRKDC